MSNIVLIIILAAILVLLAYAIFWSTYLRRRPKKNIKKTEKIQQKWTELQQLCKDKATWGEAVKKADDLLELALKKKRVSGKNIGERLVKAQKLLTDNDSVWFGHKLRAKIDAEPTMKLKEADVKQALVGIRQALKDLGALPNGQPADKK